MGGKKAKSKNLKRLKRRKKLLLQTRIKVYRTPNYISVKN